LFDRLADPEHWKTMFGAVFIFVGITVFFSGLFLDGWHKLSSVAGLWLAMAVFYNGIIKLVRSRTNTKMELKEHVLKPSFPLIHEETMIGVPLTILSVSVLLATLSTLTTTTMAAILFLDLGVLAIIDDLVLKGRVFKKILRTLTPA